MNCERKMSYRKLETSSQSNLIIKKLVKSLQFLLIIQDNSLLQLFPSPRPFFREPGNEEEDMCENLNFRWLKITSLSG